MQTSTNTTVEAVVRMGLASGRQLFRILQVEYSLLGNGNQGNTAATVYGRLNAESGMGAGAIPTIGTIAIFDWPLWIEAAASTQTQISDTARWNPPRPLLISKDLYVVISTTFMTEKMGVQGRLIGRKIVATADQVLAIRSLGR